MEAIVPAFLLAVISQLGERPAMLTAILADRFGRPLTVALAAGLAHLAANAVGAVAGMAMAPILTTNAQSLVLACALVSGAIGALWRVKAPGRHERWRLGPMLTPLLAIFFTALGGQTQFFTLALAVRGEPWFAAAGAATGAFVIAFIAATLGERGWSAVNFRWVRIATGVIFLAAAAWFALAAFRLV